MAESMQSVFAKVFDEPNAALRVSLPSDVEEALDDLSHFVNVKSHGAVGDGVADDTAEIQAAIDSLNANPGVIYLPLGVFLISAPLVLRNGQRLLGGAHGEQTIGTTIKAAGGFTGAALIKSYSYDNDDYWHWGSIEDLRLNCNSVAPAGIAIHSMGEQSVIRRCSVASATTAGYLLTGTHAVGTIESSSAFSCPVGAKFTSHATFSGNGGTVRIFGFSGDTNTSQIYQNGSHKLEIFGMKAEGCATVLDCAGSSTAGAAAQIVMGGYANTGTDVVKISGTARPIICLLGMGAASFTNWINDTVLTKTVPNATVGLVSLLTWNGDFFLGSGGNTIIDKEQAIRWRRPDTGALVSIFDLDSSLNVNIRDRNARSVVRATTSGAEVVSGTTSLYARVGGVATVNTTAVGNVGTGEDDLMTYSIPAAALTTDRESIEFEASGTFAATANNKQVKIKYGSAQLLATGVLASALAGDWVVRGRIIRTGATTQKTLATLTCTYSDGSTVTVTDIATGAETLANAITLKLTGEATSNDDIKQETFFVKWSPVK